MTRAVVVAAGGAPWETQVLAEIEQSPSLRLLRRCLDLAEVLALAELCDVVVLSTDLAGVGADALAALERHGAHVLGVGDDLRGRRLGLSMVQPGHLDDAIGAASSGGHRTDPGRSASSVIALWGPHGAPGRSVLAVTMSALLAGGASRVTLVDADPRGGAVAQMFALLDDVSGLVAACRSADRGDAEAIVEHTVSVGPGLRVLTGVPRAEMWAQVRRAPFELVLHQVAEACDHVVVDTGPALDDHTRLVLELASTVVVVGRADPVGLARLVRAVHELGDVACAADKLVVVNQLRSSSSWSARDISGALARLAGVTPDVVLDADYRALDTAVLRGQSPAQAAPNSPFVEGVGRLVQSLRPAGVPTGADKSRW